MLKITGLLYLRFVSMIAYFASVDFYSIERLAIRDLIVVKLCSACLFDFSFGGYWWY